ncbi:MAG: sensor histidine kinase [Myxococcota bacterium]
MPTDPIDPHLSALSDALLDRREVILRDWRRAVTDDPEVATPVSLSRAQFRDHVPEVLASFSASLAAGADHDGDDLDLHAERAAAHGMLRWQQGYDLHEVMREWGHLQRILVDELERYAADHPAVPPRAMAIARRLLALLCSEAVNESTARFVQLQQAEAAAQVRDLEEALDARQERQQAEVLRGAAHDLRGSLGIVLGAASILARDDVPRDRRAALFGMVERAVASQQSLLGDLMNLARLQAGQERREVAPFDAATLLTDLCETAGPLASARGLTLTADGPAALEVVGDAVKVRRIVQNLLLNAIAYTDDGGISVQWGDSRADDPRRWRVTVRDTGPGFEAGPSGPLAHELEAATVEVHDAQRLAAGISTMIHPTPPTRPTPAPGVDATHRRQGEGIGLAIVKRLCELLDASLELDTRPGRGSEFRVVLPRSYD